MSPTRRKHYGAELPLPVTSQPTTTIEPQEEAPAQLLRLSEAAKRLAVCERTLRREIRAGRIRAVKINKNLRISEAEIRRVVAQGTK